MARKPFGFRPSLRQQRTGVARLLQHMAQSAPDDKREAAIAMADGAAAAIKPKRVRAAPRQLEAPVLAAILDFLYSNPLTLLVVRQNSGSASYEAASGKWAPVRFYEIIKRPEKMRIVDVWGLLTNGRFYAVEAKEPNWRGPGTTDSDTHVREREQAAFLKMIREAGGIGIFATSAEDVATALR